MGVTDDLENDMTEIATPVLGIAYKHLTTWRDLIARQATREAILESLGDLDTPFDENRDLDDCGQEPRFNAWTENWILFPVSDGHSTWVGKAPRNPGERCEACKGTNEIEVSDGAGYGYMDTVFCNATGCRSGYVARKNVIDCTDMDGEGRAFSHRSTAPDRRKHKGRILVREHKRWVDEETGKVVLNSNLTELLPEEHPRPER
jgi:hypothetical protein